MSKDALLAIDRLEHVLVNVAAGSMRAETGLH